MRTAFRTLIVVLPAAALALLAGCAGTGFGGDGGAPAVEAPAYAVGDRWTYSATDGFFRSAVTWTETHEVMAVGADGVTVRITQKGSTVANQRIEQWPAPGKVRVGALFDAETRRFDPVVLDRYRYPLASGRTWSQWLDNFDESTGKPGQINHYVRVGGWDKVTTPAGTFDAISLRVLMRLDDEEFWRWPTTCNYLVWYAPAVRGIVREEKEGQYREKGDAIDGQSTIRSQHAVVELTGFTPGKR
ncbi:MAG: hypothetical protein ABI886_02015 [Betaproteobacteria bacterium]